MKYIYKNNKNIFKKMKECVEILKQQKRTNKIGTIPQQQNYTNHFNIHKAYISGYTLSFTLY